MDLLLLIAGLVQVVLALLTAVLFVYAAFSFFRSMTRNIDEMKELANNNISVGLLSGSIIFSIAYIVKSSIEPATDALSQVLRSADSAILDYLKVTGIMLGHILIAGILSFFSVYLALRLFMGLTRHLDELAEIRRNNIAVGILVAVIVISIALFIEPGVRTILESLIPLPPTGIAEIG